MPILHNIAAFIWKHPGIVLVLIGVVGEIVLEWKYERGKLGWWKRTFWILLILGLALEIPDAAQTDKEAAEIGKQAGEANERAGKANQLAAESNERSKQLQSTNDLLSLQVEKLVSANLEAKRALLAQAQKIQEIANSESETRNIVGEPATTERLNEAKRIAENVHNVLSSSNLANLELLPRERSFTAEQIAYAHILLGKFQESPFVLESYSDPDSNRFGKK